MMDCLLFPVVSFDALLVFCSLAMMKLDCYDETLHIVICMDRWNYVQPTMYVWIYMCWIFIMLDIYVLAPVIYLL